MKSINLWECLTSAEMNHRRNDSSPSVLQSDLTELGRAARFYQQELSVEATDEGWLLRVFGCDSEDFVSEVIILIPKDGGKPVEVRKDRIGRREYHHD